MVMWSTFGDAMKFILDDMWRTKLIEAVYEKNGVVDLMRRVKDVLSFGFAKSKVFHSVLFWHWVFGGCLSE